MLSFKVQRLFLSIIQTGPPQKKEEIKVCMCAVCLQSSRKGRR